MIKLKQWPPIITGDTKEVLQGTSGYQEQGATYWDWQQATSLEYIDFFLIWAQSCFQDNKYVNQMSFHLRKKCF